MRTEEGPEVWKIHINSDFSIAYFGADEKLKSLALSARPDFKEIDGRFIKVIEGRIATADEYATEFHRWISQFNVNVEAEGGAVAQVCYKLGRPFVIIRANTLEEGAFEALKKHASKVSGNSTLLVSEITDLLD